MDSTVETLDKGIGCLVEHMGVLEAEHFIAAIKRENFDYTKWQREFFDGMEQGQFHKEAVEYAKTHPHQGKGERL